MHESLYCILSTLLTTLEANKLRGLDDSVILKVIPSFQETQVLARAHIC